MILIIVFGVWAAGLAIVAAFIVEALLLRREIRDHFLRESPFHRWIEMPSYALLWPLWSLYVVGVIVYRAIMEPRQ